MISLVFQNGILQESDWKNEKRTGWNIEDKNYPNLYADQYNRVIWNFLMNH